MKRLIKQGTYSLIETKKQTKVLILDDIVSLAWVYAEGIGQILVRSGKRQRIGNILSLGKYRLYSIKNEPKLTDLQHLELELGQHQWQGYLLPNGLPTVKDKKNMIIPTSELVPAKDGKNSVFESMMENMHFVSNRSLHVM